VADVKLPPALQPWAEPLAALETELAIALGPLVRQLDQLITRARELKLRIGAQGVRDERHATRLREHGVLAARGPFILESATDDEVDELIERLGGGAGRLLGG